MLRSILQSWCVVDVPRGENEMGYFSNGTEGERYDEDRKRRDAFMAGFDDVPGAIPRRMWWQAFLLTLAFGTMGGCVMVLVDKWVQGS